ncbi:ECF transporter S component [Caldalkalibacillus mannanilyticus]|uniref:ECF transporter S component n=1 Tax=Caldalkalibacillus mannanilyticus TaxID=1418 RepID=UPI00046812E9|nr:ECF transporter S component [Caldalkalibacillus mannanilyticus]
MKRNTFTTMDIVLMALLAVANGVLTTYLAYVNKLLTTLGGPIATSTIVGIYMLYGMLAIYIIRKPGSALITYLLGATVQILMGNAYGVPAALTAALCYAVAIEGVFALFRYKKWGYSTMMIASLCAVPLWFVFAAYMFGYLKWDLSILFAALLVRCLSGMILCGVFSKWIGDRLAATGLLKLFAAGKPESR